MFIRKLMECDEFTAGDNTILREMLNPDKQDIEVRYSLAHAKLAPGKSSTAHALKTTEVYYILSGTGLMHIDGESRNVEPGDTVYIPPTARQFIESTGNTPLEFLCIVDPTWRPENEIVFLRA